MIRVLHIVGKMDRAGAETMLMNLYRHIDRTQVQFDFITFTTDQGDYDEEILALGGQIFPILANNPIERMFKLTNFLKQHSEYQIVHAHMLLSNAFHLLAAKYAGVPHLISHSHNTSNRKTGKIIYLYEKFCLYLNKSLPTKKIACGEKAAEYLFGTNNNIFLLKNAIDLELYREIALSNKDYWKTINQDSKGLKIIQVGRLNDVKNHFFSLDVMKILKKENIKFTYFIVGQGTLEESIKQKIKDNRLENNVYLLGVRDDVPNLMAGADVMLMPSLHEGFPVVLVESQAIGLPAFISTNISKEVDLGVGLVNFLELSSHGEWVEAIKNMNYIEKICSRSNIEILKNCGFDIEYNSKNLLKMYLNMLA
ncbi:glycosyltransferase [Acinetobacter lwoffii]|uniref:glycosyltransferase n=1 Tax=Acinetobacter lwoffii TaxID=28090 RepID=UPI0032B38338